MQETSMTNKNRAQILKKLDGCYAKWKGRELGMSNETEVARKEAVYNLLSARLYYFALHFTQISLLKFFEEWSANRSIDIFCIMRIREDELSPFDSFFITSGPNSMTKEWRWTIWEQLWKVSPNLVNVKRLHQAWWKFACFPRFANLSVNI